MYVCTSTCVAGCVGTWGRIGQDSESNVSI